MLESNPIWSEFVFKQLNALETRITLQDSVFRILAIVWVVLLASLDAPTLLGLILVLGAITSSLMWFTMHQRIERRINTLEDVAVTLYGNVGFKDLLVRYRKRDGNPSAVSQLESVFWGVLSFAVGMSKLFLL